MSRSRTKALGAPAEAGKVLGVPVPLLLVGLAAAAGLAWVNSGPATPGTPNPAPGAGNGTTPGTTPTGGTQPTTTTPATGKPKRAAVLKASSPLLYVFINSVGGEGIFARLKTDASVFDGNGLERIVTLANKEFAGFWTGKEWTSNKHEVYIQLYQKIGNIGYNCWVQKAETVQVHSGAASAGYNWTDYTHTSDQHQSDIADFWFKNYTL